MEIAKNSPVMLPRVARIVSILRVGSVVFSIASFIAAAISALAYFYFSEIRIAGILGIVFSFISITCHGGMSSLSMLDETLGKKREVSLPWRWWVLPCSATLVALFSLGVSVMTN